ncbi:MAG: hypothetical protein K0S54_3145, partial [Alphaproteobacteria bacterium]|nr:hypothetical protein [Alphaproteobacteria bacterium]
MHARAIVARFFAVLRRGLVLLAA